MAMTTDELNSLHAWVGELVEWDTDSPRMRSAFGDVASGRVMDVHPFGLLIVCPTGWEGFFPSSWAHLAVDKVRKPAPMAGRCPRCGHTL